MCAFIRRFTGIAESWQNGYCTSLENWRPKGHGGSNPSLSATTSIVNIRLISGMRDKKLRGSIRIMLQHFAGARITQVLSISDLRMRGQVHIRQIYYFRFL